MIRRLMSFKGSAAKPCPPSLHILTGLMKADGMTKGKKVAAGPAPHGSHDDNMRRTSGESRPQGDIPWRADPISVPNGRRVGQITAIYSRISINKKCKLKR
jgi:hypothetical protein